MMERHFNDFCCVTVCLNNTVFVMSLSNNPYWIFYCHIPHKCTWLFLIIAVFFNIVWFSIGSGFTLWIYLIKIHRVVDSWLDCIVLLGGMTRSSIWKAHEGLKVSTCVGIIHQRPIYYTATSTVSRNGCPYYFVTKFSWLELSVI